jgi:IS30 family transposase
VSCGTVQESEEKAMAKNKHLTIEERLTIQHLLGEQKSLKEIAAKLNKHPTTISREVRARVIVSDKGARYRIRNRCVRRANCNRYNLCEDKSQCTRRCSACNLCNEICPDFEEQICGKLFESPYCCNGCLDEYQCVLRKKYYINRKAHEAYRETLIESRVGANITEVELLALDEMVSPLIMRGQSVHHIVSSNPDDFNISEKSIYRYVDGGLLTARNIDMPRVCRMKPRKTKPVVHKVDGSCRIGRTYAEYEAFLKENPLSVVEMDSVIGRVGGKVLLTLMFTSCDFMLAFIRERNTSQSVIDIFNMLYKLLGVDAFTSMFPLLLGDNGSEFSNPLKLEFDSDGIRRTSVFYCDPNAAFQKPHVELNHEFIRRILPKGTSFDNLDQDAINLMLSHINSYSREKLGNKSPLEMFGFIYGHDILDKLRIKKIPAVEIMLKPALLK